MPVKHAQHAPRMHYSSNPMEPDVSNVPDLVHARFGSRRAKPRLTRVYRADVGWTRAHSHSLLTASLLANLAQGGYTIIEGKWRWRVREIPLTPSHFERR